MLPKPKKRILTWGIAALSLTALTIWIAWGNSALECNTYTVKSARLPKSFDGYRIAQVSDLHNAALSEGNQKLLEMLRQAQPDMIAITGDLVDSRKLDMDIALDFITEAVKIAPCYYVTGNHEARIRQYKTMKKEMKAAGVIVLEDATIPVTKDGESITLIGMQDPSFHGAYKTSAIEKVVQEQLTQLHRDSGFSIMLFHRPSYFPMYVSHGVDLVLAGHMHGGQFRLPFVGGLYTPSQGFFPEYDGGLYSEGNTNMVVSRGIGNSAFPFRINNRPEIVLIELQTEE